MSNAGVNPRIGPFLDVSFKNSVGQSLDLPRLLLLRMAVFSLKFTMLQENTFYKVTVKFI